MFWYEEEAFPEDLARSRPSATLILYIFDFLSFYMLLLFSWRYSDAILRYSETASDKEGFHKRPYKFQPDYKINAEVARLSRAKLRSRACAASKRP